MLVDHEMLLGMNDRFAPKAVALKSSLDKIKAHSSP
jgi:hypothetical protein